MANPVEYIAPTDRHQLLVIEIAMRLTQELLRLRPEGTRSDQWLVGIFGLARAVAEVATVAGGSPGSTTRGAPPTGQPFLPLARGRVKVKPSSVGRAKHSGCLMSVKHKWWMCFILVPPTCR
jgi:hypothetical protein